jgi:hypothetical protein
MKDVLERMAASQEEMVKVQKHLVSVIESQRPGKAGQVLATVAGVATISGLFGAIDLVVKWILGG